VEITLAHLLSIGSIRADGGQSGEGGNGGLSGTSQVGHCLYYGVVTGGRQYGCSGGSGCGDGGDGGRGARAASDCSEDGQNGEQGQPGQDGEIIVHEDPSSIGEVHSGVSVPCLVVVSPNPFRQMVECSYVVPSRTKAPHVNLAVYDAGGRLIEVLVDAERSPGIHQTRWSGRDKLGDRLPAGAYFFRLSVNGARQARRVILLR
jgi:hypothetical protein